MLKALKSVLAGALLGAFAASAPAPAGEICPMCSLMRKSPTFPTTVFSSVASQSAEQGINIASILRAQRGAGTYTPLPFSSPMASQVALGMVDGPISYSGYGPLPGSFGSAAADLFAPSRFTPEFATSYYNAASGVNPEAFDLSVKNYLANPGALEPLPASVLPATAQPAERVRELETDVATGAPPAL